MTTGEHSNLSLDENSALETLAHTGSLVAQLYRQGEYSEPGFVLHGVMQRLVIRGLATYLGCSGDDRNITYSYGSPTEQVRVAA